MANRKIVVGTRGSDLALWQAGAAEAAIASSFPDVTIERKIITTTGDRRTDVALSQVAKVEGVNDKGVFTKELEIALRGGEIDIAVHSLKDVPTVLESDFMIAGVLERERTRDVLITRDSNGLDGLPADAVIGTSSVRRARQIQWLRPDVIIKDIRGNVPTRLKKLSAGDEFDAIMLAEAGLKRLGLLEYQNDCFFHLLDENHFYPAAGQGAVGLEIRSDDDYMKQVVHAINHVQSFVQVSAEREFLRLLNAGCHTPVGVFCYHEADVLYMRSRVFHEESFDPKTSQSNGSVSDWKAIANELFLQLK